VLDLTGVGSGCPDKLVDVHGVNVLVEIKAAKGKLRAGQEEFRRGWRGPVEVARSLEDVQEVVRRYRKGPAVYG
jgi:hypothetical protein